MNYNSQQIKEMLDKTEKQGKQASTEEMKSLYRKFYKVWLEKYNRMLQGQTKLV